MFLALLISTNVSNLYTRRMESLYGEKRIKLCSEEKQHISGNRANMPAPHGSAFSSSLNKVADAAAMHAPGEAAEAPLTMWFPSPRSDKTDGGAATIVKDGIQLCF